MLLIAVECRQLDEPSSLVGDADCGKRELAVAAPRNILSRNQQLGVATASHSKRFLDHFMSIGLVAWGGLQGIASGNMIHMEYLTKTRVQLHYEMPLNEVIYDFFDALKSRTRGYASLDYEFLRYQPAKLVKLDILLNRELIDALSTIVPEEEAMAKGRGICEKLKDIIPRHQFEVPIQAAIGQKIIARETVRAYRKDVLAKCYGGDVSRKKKLLEKQKAGKKRMRQFGTVTVPQEAFTEVLKLDDGR